MIVLAYHPAAQTELEAEIDFCERAQRGAGAHVRADIAETLQLLAEFPELGRLDDDGTRRMVTNRYRFIIHYEVAGNQLVVWAVAHHAREPGYWSARR